MKRGAFSAAVGYNGTDERKDVPRMKKKITLAVMLLCVTVMMSGCWMAGYTNKGADNVRSASKFMDTFSGKTISGKKVDSSIFKGHKLTMLYFWGTYDSAGIRQFDTIEDISKEYEDDMQVIGVIANVREKNKGVVEKKLARAENSLDEHNVTYMNIIPSQKMVSKMQKALEVIPVTIFVDSNGRQVGRDQAGVKERKVWDQTITEYLNK
jgi:AhpC/TSA family.